MEDRLSLYHAAGLVLVDDLGYKIWSSAPESNEPTN